MVSLISEQEPSVQREGAGATRLLAASDAELVQRVSLRLSQPRQEEADSFVLHAPLELCARSALLPYVAPSARELARARILGMLERFEGSTPMAPARAEHSFDSLDAAAARLVDAIDRGELDDVDAISSFLGRNARPRQLVRLLADNMIPRLSAAAHAPIFLHQLPRVAPRGELAGTLLRPLAREVAREPTWRLAWSEGIREERAASSLSLRDTLRNTPSLGLPGSDFIYPLLSRVDASGLAERLLAVAAQAADLRDGAHELMRAAALSMLVEPPDFAAYGWTHCLTLPQAIVGISWASKRPRRALAVAATHVLAFRVAMAKGPLPDAYEPSPSALSVARALDDAPDRAAASMWHTESNALGEAVTALVTFAATHEDAHLAKYTLACLDAAADDPEHARLYLAAAASLAGTWRRRDGVSPDPLSDKARRGSEHVESCG